jgi:AtzE family amidohydrolase
VAAGLVDFSLGTDTNGSIRVPSSFCGVFGLKPTFGRLPRSGTFPFVHDLDHLGPFARSADDLALVYDTIQGHDGDDLACADRPAEPVLPLIEGGLKGRVGVLDGWFDDLADDQGRAATAAVAQALGAQDRVTLRGAAQARAAAFILTCASGGNLHFDALATRADEFDPATRDRLLAGTLVPADLVLRAQRYRTVFRDEVLALFNRYDLLLAPATPCSAPELGQPTIHVGGQDVPTRANIGLLTQPLSFVGLPIVAVPVRGEGMPIAVQLIAPPWREGQALQAAALLERAGVVRGPEAVP